jgi:hypothetical protein
LVGDLLHGRYRIAEALAAGGAGNVHLATEEPGGLRRVIKELRANAPQILSAFRGEFALLARVSHPHLLRVLDFGTALIRQEPVHYYVAQWLPAAPLAQVARRSGAQVGQLLQPLLDALEGLAVLHALEIRHGDFTPSNVMVDDAGRGTLIDLGCAQQFGSSAWLSGTEGYIAPELLQGARADGRADLYSVGKTLERVFELAALPPPEHILRMIERLLRSDPADRPADVGEVLEAFKRRLPAIPRQIVPLRLLGRDQQLGTFAGWLSALVRNEAVPRTFALVGKSGSGLSRLLRELVWRAQLEVSVFRVHAGDPECVGRCLAIAAGFDQPVRTLRGVLGSFARLKEAGVPVLIVAEDIERLEAEQQQLLLSFLRLLEGTAGAAVVISGRNKPDGIEAVVATCDPLGPEDVTTWVAPFLPARRIPEFVSVTAGLPAAIEAELKRLHSAANDQHASPRVDTKTKLPRLASAEILALSVIAAAGGELEVIEPLLDWQTVESLIAQNLGERAGARVKLYRSTLSAISEGGVSRNDMRAAHRRLAEMLATTSPASLGVAVRLAMHLAEADEQQRADQVFLDCLGELRKQPRAAIELFRSAFF